MPTAAHHPPLVEYDDLVRLDRRCQSLGDHDRGRVTQNGPQSRTYVGLGQAVQRGKGVIEKIDVGPPEDRSGDGQPLSLAAGKVSALRVDSCPETVR